MNDEKYSELFSFESEIKENGEIDFPTDTLKTLFHNGFSEIKVSVFGDAKKIAEKNGVDPLLFEKVKSVQGLPDYAVLDMLMAKGSIADSEFINRIKY